MATQGQGGTCPAARQEPEEGSAPGGWAVVWVAAAVEAVAMCVCARERERGGLRTALVHAHESGAVALPAVWVVSTPGRAVVWQCARGARAWVCLPCAGCDMRAAVVTLFIIS